jgi:hypothetical protein
MNIIFPIIILLIITFFSILIINRKYYFSEDFTTGSYDQNTIEDIIPLLYEPSNPYLKEELTEYEIIDIYKRILDRAPNMEELKLKILKNKEDLIEELYNSYEYEKLTKVQDNLAEGGIESSIAKRNLLRKIITLYKNKYQKEPNDNILMPLRDCYIHLRSNKYLFKAFLEADNYLTFENDVLTTKTITKKILLEIFNKYYNLLELKLKAEEFIKNSKGGIEDKNQDMDVETLKKELSKITKEPIQVVKQETLPNVSNISEINKYLNKETFDNGDIQSTIKKLIDNAKKPLKENFNTDDTSDNSLKENFNTEENGDIQSTIKRLIDNAIDSKSTKENLNTEENGDIQSTIKRLVNNAIASNPNMKLLVKDENEVNPNKEEIPKEKPNEIRKITNELPENSEVYVRVYNPIEYKQQSYIGDARFRPPICTSLGQKSLEQPVYMSSSVTKGEDLNNVFQETQVGSIMPKFIYKEYQDVRIK